MITLGFCRMPWPRGDFSAGGVSPGDSGHNTALAGSLVGRFLHWYRAQTLLIGILPLATAYRCYDYDDN